MPRNEAKPLDLPAVRLQSRNHNLLAPLVDTDTEVTVHYTKRNGEASFSRGKVQFFNGKPGFDTGSVTIDTTATKGRPTTVNLHNIYLIG